MLTILSFVLIDLVISEVGFLCHFARCGNFPQNGSEWTFYRQNILECLRATIAYKVKVVAWILAATLFMATDLYLWAAPVALAALCQIYLWFFELRSWARE
ncbi:MAG TPA: hypothetical protein VI913_03900 [Candidatus Peribacteraceae bacterium]|nr:hypothetical protein [Candidatus Peribacteraceae bacterium]